MTASRPIVLVTGASGFVGRHVISSLAREGWSVRRVMRRSSGDDNEVLIDTIGGTTDWRAALDGVEAVVHLAARVHRPHEEYVTDAYHVINTEGTVHLAKCAAAAGVRHFLFVSTVLVHGRCNNGRPPFRETDILTPRDAYGMSKAAAETGLRALAQGGDMHVTVIRPPLVYGAGARGNFQLLARAIDLGIPLPFAAIANQRAFLSVQNLASFVLQRLAHGKGAFDVFLLADEEQVSTPEFIRRLARAAGASSRLFPIPPTVLSALFRISGQLEARDSLIGSLQLDISKAASTGWRPKLTLDEGLRLATRDRGKR